MKKKQELKEEMSNVRAGGIVSPGSGLTLSSNNNKELTLRLTCERFRAP